MKNNNTFFRFIKFLKPEWKKAFIAFLLMLLAAGLGLPMPFLTQYIIDNVIVVKNYNLLNIICFVLLGVLLLRCLTSFLEDYFLTIFRGKILLNIRQILFDHLQRLPISYFHKKETGYLMSRVSGDVNAVQGLLAQTLTSFAQSILTFIVGVFATLYLHTGLAIICFMILPFYLLSLYVFNKRVKDASLIVREKYANVEKDLQELISGVLTIKIFVGYNRSNKRLASSLFQAIREDIKLDILASISNITSVIISSLGPLVLIWYGCIEIMNGNLTVGGLLAFNSFIRYLFDPARVLYSINVNIQRSLAACERIFEILDTNIEGDGNKEFKCTEGLIVYDHVWFSYNNSDFILKDISFTAQPGEFIAIVGKSGIGKTTLLNLIPRVYNPTKGKILIDGEDITELKLSYLRKQIGFVSQDVFLFSGTILENIKYGMPNASLDEVQRAVKIASLDEFIESLPQKYDTKVGERGVTISGGQRQRIAIARAILLNPKILILDEATSHLDGDTERQIQKSIEQLIEDRTIVVIAHRLTTILNADKIIILDCGRIVDIGSHEFLISNSPIYNQLFSEKYFQ